MGENFVLAATLDVWNEFRMKKNMSDAMKYSEKVKIEEKVTCMLVSIPSCKVRNHNPCFSPSQMLPIYIIMLYT